MRRVCGRGNTERGRGFDEGGLRRRRSSGAFEGPAQFLGRRNDSRQVAVLTSTETFAFNQLLRENPKLAGSVGSNYVTRNVLANRIALGDTAWVESEGMERWEPACTHWLLSWVTSAVTLKAMRPWVESVAATCNGSKWPGSLLPGQLALLDMDELHLMVNALLRLSPADYCEEQVLALYLLVGWRDGVEIPLELAGRIVEQPMADPEYLLSSHRWTALNGGRDWQLLRLAVQGPEEYRLVAAQAWANDSLWHNAVLLGLDLLPCGPYLTNSYTFDHEYGARAIAWAQRLKQVHWFEPDYSPSLLMELENGPSPLVESLIAYCGEHQDLEKLSLLADDWLSPWALQQFNRLLGRSPRGPSRGKTVLVRQRGSDLRA